MMKLPERLIEVVVRVAALRPVAQVPHLCKQPVDSCFPLKTFRRFPPRGKVAVLGKLPRGGSQQGARAFACAAARDSANSFGWSGGLMLEPPDECEMEQRARDANM